MAETAGSDHMSSRSSTAMFFPKLEFIKMASKSGTIHEFGHNVGMVVAAGNLGKLKVFPTDSFLNPKIRHRQVAHAPKPPAAADSDSRSAVGEDLDGARQAQVGAQALQSQGDGGALRDAGQFRFSGAHSHDSLSMAPCFHQVRAQQSCAARC